MVRSTNDVYIASASRTSTMVRGSRKKKTVGTMPLPVPSTARTLTAQEKQWASAIRDAVIYHNANASGGYDVFTYDALSDLEYAQHAIVAKDNVGKALKRIQKLQEFKRAHVTSQTTVYHAIALVQSFVDAHPDVLMSLGTIPPGTGTVVGFRPAGLHSKVPMDSTVDPPPEFPVALYHIFQALQADLDDIRHGTVWIGDLDMESTSSSVASWRTVISAAAQLTRDAYPIRVRHVSLLRASPWVRTVLRMIRQVFFSRKIQQVLDVDDASGSQTRLIRQGLPASALPPCCGGTQRSGQVMNGIRERLRKRYQMEETFRF